MQACAYNPIALKPLLRLRQRDRLITDRADGVLGTRRSRIRCEDGDRPDFDAADGGCDVRRHAYVCVVEDADVSEGDVDEPALP